jgi:hypothetical protein
MPVSDLDRWRAAQQLIKHHGLAAELNAAQRAAGDPEGESLWRDIIKKIRLLQQTQPPGSLVN